MVIKHGEKHHLEPATKHTISQQVHEHTRGHEAHLDITEHTDPDTIIEVEFEVSTDQGRTWQKGGGFTQKGGPVLDKEGNPLTHVYVHFGHEPTPRHKDHRGMWVGSDPAPHRLVRGTVKVNGKPVTTSLKVAGTRHAPPPS